MLCSSVSQYCYVHRGVYVWLIILYIYLHTYIGFSSGGLIACMVSSLLWKENSYIGSDELKANTMCLTFGQPIINLPCIAELVQKYPDFNTTLHQIYLKSDVIPQIFHCAASKQISLVITNKVSCPAKIVIGYIIICSMCIHTAYTQNPIVLHKLWMFSSKITLLTYVRMYHLKIYVIPYICSKICQLLVFITLKLILDF